MNIKMDTGTCVTIIISLFLLAMIITDIIEFFKYRVTLEKLVELPGKERREFIKDICESNRMISDVKNVLTKEEYEDEFGIKNDG